MTPEKIAGLIQKHLSDAKVFVDSDDNVHFSAVVVCDCFKDLNKVAQQQKVYAALEAELASGELHALALKTYTPDKWAAKQNG